MNNENQSLKDGKSPSLNGGRRTRINDDDDDGIAISTQLLDDNDQCLIDNPLMRLTADEVEQKVKRFIDGHFLHVQDEVFLKAGKILRDPEAWQSVPGLTVEEEAALTSETEESFWAKPKDLRVTIITLCVAAVVQGWNQTASNGANLNWPQQLGLGNVSSCDPVGTEAWIFGLVNAITYLSASLVGCWISDPLNEYFYGRRSAICVSAILILVSMIGAACSRTWPELFACRLILGIGMGSKAAVVPVFAAEVSPAYLRGSLVMNWQLFDAFGIFLGYTANLIVSQVGPTAWRWQTASSVLPTIVLLSLIFVSTESPRFLMKKGPASYHSAYKSLLRLRGEPIIAAKELLYIHFQMDVERRFMLRHVPTSKHTKPSTLPQGVQCGSAASLGKVKKHTRSVNYWQKLWQLFSKKNKRCRRAMAAAVVCMVGQQACGVNVLSAYSSTFFCDAANQSPSASDLQPLFLSWGIGLTNFLFAIPAYWLIDKRGRRWLLLAALPLMALSMFAASLSFLIPVGNPARVPAICVFLYIFMVFYSPSMGPVPFTMSAEVFPLDIRVVGMSFAVFTNMFGFGLLTLFVPIITYYVGHVALLAIFAGLNVVVFVLVFFFVRETAGARVGRTPGSMTFMSLEELNYVFGVPTRKYARYQIKTVLPWVWRRYFKRDSSCRDEPEQLYTWANTQRACEMGDVMNSRHQE